MRNKKKVLLIVLPILLIFVVVLGVFLKFALTKKNFPTAEACIKQYISFWQKENYPAMYTILSKEDKSKINATSFADEYTKIYGIMKASNIKIDADVNKEIKSKDEKQSKMPISTSMDTLAGSLKYTYYIVVQKEYTQKAKTFGEKIQDYFQGQDYQWVVKWDRKMILPQLETGDSVAVDYPKDMKAKRGEIKDRNGQLLAANGTAVQIGIQIDKMKGDQAALKAQLAQILNISTQQIDKSLSASWVKANVFVPIATVLKDDTDKIQKCLAIPGVLKMDKAARVYPGREACAHLIGYISAVTQDDLKKLKDQGYSNDDYVGRAGIEQVFEKRLKGENGLLISTVDTKGQRKKTIVQKLPKDGENIQLTVDLNIQRAITNQMGIDSGCASAVNPKTGEILALVSSPAYDPNNLVNGTSDKYWNALSSDPKKPLINKFNKAYAPGSTFKMLTAAVGLKTGKLNPDKQEDIQGKTWQPNGSWGKYFVTRVSDPGRPENLQDAFIFSDNIYFAKAALAIGKEDFVKEAKNFGLGENLPIPYPMQTSQLSNGGNITKDVLLGDSGYGQGQVLVTPLHLALIYSTLVNNGSLVSPILESKDKTDTPKFWHENIYPAAAADIIRNDLIQVIENPSGTGHAAQTQGLVMAGKTGTAELKVNQDDKNGKENGWFTAINVDNPKLVVTMMIEDVKDRGESHYVVPKVAEVMRQFAK